MGTSLFTRGSDKILRKLGLGGNFKRGEIKDDSLFNAISREAADPSHKTQLEVGSSTGDGSTQAFLQGVRRNPSQPKLFCIEALKDRYNHLLERLKDTPNTFAFNVTAVPMQTNCTEKIVREFTQIIPMGNVETVLSWSKEEHEYVAANEIPQNGIERIKREHNVTNFDLVLLDGSEFAGLPELEAVYGAKTIIMDDVAVLKNHYGLLKLIYDPAYRLVESDMKLRNGYAVFKRVD